MAGRARREDFVLGRRGAAGCDAQDAEPRWICCRRKQVAVRRQPDGARAGEAGCHHLDRKAGGTCGSAPAGIAATSLKFGVDCRPAAGRAVSAGA